MRLTVILVLGLMFCAKISAQELKNVTHKEVNYRIFITDPDKLELYWKDETDKPFATFAKVQELAESKGRRIVFIMNGGIFEPGPTPAGLHVENGKVLNPLNLKDGEGNFYLKPNGVFLVGSDGKAAILESSEYAKAALSPRIALQAGPLLLRNGKIHPKFSSKSSNDRHRNAVGIDRKGRAVFVITETQDKQKKFPSLHMLAEFFLSLDCQDALFLDGDISAMYVNPAEKIKHSNKFAAIFAVTEEASASK